MTKPIVLLAFLLLSWSCLAEQQNWYFIRHFEKQQGSDPHLTETGALQAQALVTALTNTTLSQIYSTQYKRTLESAAPLAAERGLDITLYDPAQLTLLAEQISQQNNVLVVGHSNTTAQIIRLMGGQLADLTEADYGQLFILTKEDSHTKLSVQKIALK